MACGCAIARRGGLASVISPIWLQQAALTRVMPLPTLLFHLLCLCLPAWGLGLLLALSTRVIWKGYACRLALLANWAALGLSGSLVLLLGLPLTGQDGSMLTYALLVVVLASVQWLLLRPLPVK